MGKPGLRCFSKEHIRHWYEFFVRESEDRKGETMSEIGDVKQDIERAKTLQQAVWAALERAEMHLAAVDEEKPPAQPQPKEGELWVDAFGNLRVRRGDGWQRLDGEAEPNPKYAGVRPASRGDVERYVYGSSDVAARFICDHFKVSNDLQP